MKVLISAYACEPNNGSEPGVGWGWATELAKKHEVWVLTRDNNQTCIEKYMRDYPQYNMPNLHFIYVGLPKCLTFWKKGNRGIRLYYMMWQKAAYRMAKQWHKNIEFDYVHHVTFVSYTQPTYIYKLGIPMIWGPVAGGDNIPNQIKIEMTLKEQLVEKIRLLSQIVSLWFPSIRNTMRRSTLILTATEETKHKIPNAYQNKTFVLPAIGLENAPEIQKKREVNGTVNIIMAGRLIYWKAFDIGLKAFLQIADQYPQVQLHILGEGPRKRALTEMAGSYMGKQVFFCEPVPHDRIYDFYRGFDVFLNTTLRDSGCMTMMEALSVGLPCIALDTGGPHVMGKGNPLVTLVEVKDYNTTVQTLAKEIMSLLTTIDVLKEGNTIYTYCYEDKVKVVEHLFGELLKQ